MKLRRASAVAMAAFLFLSGNVLAKQPRSTVERHAFVKEHACPATGKNRLPCPGYQIDHVIPLCASGADSRTNMQWLTIQAHKDKTREDVRYCRFLSKSVSE